MAARITGNSSTVSVASVRARASIAVQDLRAGVVTQVPVSSIAYIDMTVGVELDTTGRFKIVVETVTLNDGTQLLLSKAVEDAIEVAGERLVFSTDKGLSDQVVPFELLAQAVAKALQDLYSVPDLPSIQFARPVADAIAGSDTAVRQINKLLNSGFALNDTLDAGDGLVYAVSKGVINVVFPEDSHSVALEKLLGDAQLIVDALSVSTSKPLSDSFGQTDAIAQGFTKSLADAYATIDALVQSFSKALQDVVSMGDTYALSFERPVQDSQSLDDFVTRDVSKGLAHSVDMQDTTAADVNKALADTQSILDPLSLWPFKALAESQQVLDAYAISSAKLLADGSTAVDSATLEPIKGLSDTQPATDAVSLAPGKALTSSFPLTDSTTQSVTKGLSHSFPLADTESFDFSKALADEPVVTDSPAKTIERPVSDSFPLTDAAALTPSPGLNDQVLMAEQPYLTVDKPAADEIFATDVFNRQLDKSLLSDAAVMTEDFSRLLIYQRAFADAFAVDDSTGVGDGLAVQAIKTFNNVGAVSDVLTLATGLLETDAFSVADTGNLVSQGYCDLTYFADDYVGATRSF